MSRTIPSRQNPCGGSTRELNIRFLKRGEPELDIKTSNFEKEENRSHDHSANPFGLLGMLFSGKSWTLSWDPSMITQAIEDECYFLRPSWFPSKIEYINDIVIERIWRIIDYMSFAQS